MVSLINKQLLLTAYAYLFIMEQQKAQQGGQALQLQVESSSTIPDFSPAQNILSVEYDLKMATTGLSVKNNEVWIKKASDISEALSLSQKSCSKESVDELKYWVKRLGVQISDRERRAGEITQVRQAFEKEKGQPLLDTLTKLNGQLVGKPFERDLLAKIVFEDHLTVENNAPVVAHVLRHAGFKRAPQTTNEAETTNEALMKWFCRVEDQDTRAGAVLAALNSSASQIKKKVVCRNCTVESEVTLKELPRAECYVCEEPLDQ